MTPADPAVIRRKLAVIVSNLQALESVSTMSIERYQSDIFRRKGTERLLQELIEAAIDINTHLLTQESAIVPDDYYQGFMALGERDILSTELAWKLAPAAGLRNRLVHEYNALVDALVLHAVRKAQDQFPQYVAAIEAYLKKRGN